MACVDKIKSLYSLTYSKNSMSILPTDVTTSHRTWFNNLYSLLINMYRFLLQTILIFIISSFLVQKRLISTYKKEAMGKFLVILLVAVALNSAFGEQCDRFYHTGTPKTLVRFYDSRNQGWVFRISGILYKIQHYWWSRRAVRINYRINIDLRCWFLRMKLCI